LITLQIGRDSTLFLTAPPRGRQPSVGLVARLSKTKVQSRSWSWSWFKGFAAMPGKALAGCMPNILRRQRSDSDRHSSRADLSVVADSKVSYELEILTIHHE
jgi:hypothetical protein